MTGPRLEHPATPMVWRDLALPDTEPLHIVATTPATSIPAEVRA